MKPNNISICLLYHDLTLLFSTSNATMLFAIVITHLVVASVANPFHKYPFVFLLDVGNEELEKTNTEQIRVSIPGGSLAVRYPAISDGDLITHVRVSGIDFGTDLKANILDGGPGYKYVVLVFAGNTGLPYDVVVTLQTAPSNLDSNNINRIPTYKSNSANTNTIQNPAEGDVNNSAEEMDNYSEKTAANDVNNAEIIEPSSKVYKYEQLSENDNVIDESYSNEGSTHDDYDGNKDLQNKEKYLNEVTDENEDDDNSEDNNENSHQAEKLQFESSDDFVYKSKYNTKSLDDTSVHQEESLDADARMYNQDNTYDAQGHNAYSGEDADEVDQMFNDEEIHNDADKYKDSNNNNFDSDYDSAIAY